MKSLKFFLFFLIPFNALLAQDIVGTWQGLLNFYGSDIRIVYHISLDSNGVYSATTDSPDQGIKDVEADEIDVFNDSLHIDFYNWNAGFSGKFNWDSLAYIGYIRQNGFKIPFKIVKGEDDDLLYFRPQKPKKPFPYVEEEVSIENKKSGITLSGTLTKPAGNGKFPAIILITGSGPEDRDETVMAHKPFLLISDFLTRRGIAVLRCDDRGTAKSTGDFKSATAEGFATDAIAQFDFLLTRSDIDKQKIGLLGHSEGGMIAPMVTIARPSVAFNVLLAAPAINLFDLIVMQDSLISLADGMSQEKIHEHVATNKKVFDFVRYIPDSATAADSIDRYLTSHDAPVREINSTIDRWCSPWMRWYIDFDPKENLRKLKCPVLAMNGEKDVQVPAGINISTIEEVLKKSGNKNYETIILPGLNHLFQECRKCSVKEYSKIDETMNEAALLKIGNWLSNILKVK